MVKVLVLCVHNSARSQMAEAFINDYGKDLFIAESAGIEKGELNPYVVKAMKEIGYDISKNETNSVFDFYKEGRRYTFVIKVCDTISGQKCPIFPHTLKDFNWDVSDPSEFAGSESEIMDKVRNTRDIIKEKVMDFINTYKTFAEQRK
ncbi:MAG: arsenate reductase ArsC [Bacillota bacterium]